MSPARAVAAAKINLALVVGGPRADGLHEVATVLQRIDVCDRIELSAGEGLVIEGFPDDTIVAAALTGLAAEAGVEPAWCVRISKEIPVAAGLGGGSADAAAALRLANASLPEPLASERLNALAAQLGADVPFFLEPGPKLAEGTGDRLSHIELPQDFWVRARAPHRAREAFHSGRLRALRRARRRAGLRRQEGRARPKADRRTPAGRSCLPPTQRPRRGLRRSRARARVARRWCLSGRCQRRWTGRLWPLRDTVTGTLGSTATGSRRPHLGGRTGLVTSRAWRVLP